MTTDEPCLGEGLESADSPCRRSVTVGIVSDDGFASTIAAAIVKSLPAEVYIGAAPVAVEVVRAAVTLPPTETGLAPVGQWLESVQSTDTYDVVLCVSEVPRRYRAKPVIAELREATAAALYVPSFGTVAVRRRAVRLAIELVHQLLSTDLSTRPRPRRTSSTWAPGPDPGRGDRILLTSGFFGRLRLIAGMVRCNRPWRLVPALSGALGAAAAASAFGVFYASIWQMAASMTTTRLAAIAVTAVAAMSAWLVLPNGLWEFRSSRPSRIDRWMYNGATVGTVVTGVLCMYVVLFCVVAGSATIVISPEFITAQIGRPATTGDYVSLAWLAASLGTVAGAVGSSVSDREDILAATYGHREMLRRKSAASEQQAEQR